MASARCRGSYAVRPSLSRLAVRPPTQLVKPCTVTGLSTDSPNPPNSTSLDPTWEASVDRQPPFELLFSFPEPTGSGTRPEKNTTSSRPAIQGNQSTGDQAACFFPHSRLSFSLPICIQPQPLSLRARRVPRARRRPTFFFVG